MSFIVPILLRSLTMAACAAVLTIATSKFLRLILPLVANLEQSFARLAWASAIGVLGGVVLGALLTHRLGRRTFSAKTRVGHALIAVPLALMILLGMITVMS